MSAGPVAVRVFPGLADQAGQARGWVRALASAAGAADADDAELAITELFANAVRHTRSGAEGGKVTVAVTAGGVIHVHDQGTGGPPCAGMPATRPGAERLLEVEGRGLMIVAALCAAWGRLPADRCTAAGPDDPGAGGCCTWCRPASWRPAPEREERTAHAGA